MNNRQKLGLLLLISTVIRMVVGDSIQLGNDEVYYWTYAKYPDWSHFDHPPMVGFFEQLFTGFACYKMKAIILDLHELMKMSFFGD